MKLVKAKFILEMQDFYEENVLGVDIPYFVERLEYPSEIVWLGLETNFKNKNGRWYKLKKGKWVRCKTPNYEIKFQEIQSLEARL